MIRRPEMPPDLLAICLGNAVEFYDFAVFGASATVLARVLTAGNGGLTSVFAVLAAALLVRPVGAIVMGRIADRTGRRLPFLATTLLMLGATTAVGLLPSATRAGAAAAVGLALLRCVQAFSTGGETSTSVTYLFERAPDGRRGLWGGAHLASSAAGMALGLAAVLATQTLLPPDELLAWGWRLPFLAALPLGLAAFTLRRRLQESEAFLGRPAGTRGLRELVRDHRRVVVAGALLAGAASATVTLWFVWVPALLLSTGRASAAVTLGAATLGLVAVAVVAPVAGGLSDRVGRVAVLCAGCAGLALVWPPAAVAAVRGAGFGTLALASIALGGALGGLVLAVYLPERFGPEERATGVGVSYGPGNAVVGGFAPLVAGALAAGGRAPAVGVAAAACALAALVAVRWAARADDAAPVSPRTYRGELSARRP